MNSLRRWEEMLISWEATFYPGRCAFTHLLCNASRAVLLLVYAS